jgi:hypothetical protein
MPSVEPILLTTTQISTRLQQTELTRATGFYFSRGERIFLITCRHVVIDEASGHFPDGLLITLFIDSANLARSTAFSIPLYQNGSPIWFEARDRSGSIDVVAIELDREALPATWVYQAFTVDTLCPPHAAVEVGAALMVPGYPLGFSDTLHHLPVARSATLASSFGLRFQGMGYFLTDARTHRGISGAPVVMRVGEGPASQPDMHWQLLGVHSARLDVGTRDMVLDEALGLNCAWYTDILTTLTRE